MKFLYKAVLSTLFLNLGEADIALEGVGSLQLPGPALHLVADGQHVYAYGNDFLGAYSVDDMGDLQQEILLEPDCIMASGVAFGHAYFWTSGDTLAAYSLATGVQSGASVLVPGIWPTRIAAFQDLPVVFDGNYAYLCDVDQNGNLEVVSTVDAYMNEITAKRILKIGDYMFLHHGFNMIAIKKDGNILSDYLVEYPEFEWIHSINNIDGKLLVAGYSSGTTDRIMISYDVTESGLVPWCERDVVNSDFECSFDFPLSICAQSGGDIDTGGFVLYKTSENCLDEIWSHNTFLNRGWIREIGKNVFSLSNDRFTLLAYELNWSINLVAEYNGNGMVALSWEDFPGIDKFEIYTKSSYDDEWLHSFTCYGEDTTIIVSSAMDLFRVEVAFE